MLHLVSQRSCGLVCMFHRCHSTVFSDYSLMPEIVEKLQREGLTHPTNIQQKSLESVLAGRHTVINAETGSGKTLCFLLPIIQALTRLSLHGQTIPAPYSVVLTPTPHLACQIGDVFKTLASPDWGSSIVYGGLRLALKSNTYLVIGTPTSIVQYSAQKLFRDVQVVCVDEADMLLTGGEQRATWEILEIMRNLYQRDIRSLHTDTSSASETGTHTDPSSLESRVVDKTKCETSSELSIADVKLPMPFRQLIFTAATLPSGGPKTVHSLLQKWLPKSALFISTELTHQALPTAKTTFVNVSADLQSDINLDESILSKQKFLQLANDLNRLKEEYSGNDPETSLPGILIFTNRVSNAKAVYNFLSSNLEPQLEVATGRASGKKWWAGQLGQLHKGISPEEREECLHRFRSGEWWVLVSTDLAARGLDLPQVAAVIQFDFPVNSADYLHRAGRTARAGSPGEVIAYVGPSDCDLAAEIQSVLDDRTKTFSSIFSRNKMLRRKLNARKARKLQSKDAFHDLTMY